MYKIFTANSKTEKRLQNCLHEKKGIKAKLERLKFNPRNEIGAHPLHGRLRGKWSYWLGNNIRMIYNIDDVSHKIIVEAIGSHKIY